MNKADLVDNIAKSTGMTKGDVAKVVDAFISSVIDTAKNGDKVTLVGFGAFTVTERKEREGRNPQTGAAIVIPASKAPKFAAGKAYKDAVNNKVGKDGKGGKSSEEEKGKKVETKSVKGKK
ncbi:Histone-like bacterial DNA-binding protein [Candidatus Magnetobacterium bavaricum]|uniref:Histone-like bacterial DNA-binding protein n=1 Tax=Candidatus Magnetobacterium bavaricum TaxID=29290 RepID=A0A0F3GL25_9BACT|nr:Histone-like bacterial DNA-binding protein [Candidatus Magnetobacterium bavaricum]